MSTYPRYDDETNGRANTTAQLDPYDNHSARVGFPSPDVQSPHSTEYNPYGSPGDVRSTRDDGRSVFGDPSRATLVAEEDHDPFAKVPASTSPKNDDGTTRPVSRQYEDLGVPALTVWDRNTYAFIRVRGTLLRRPCCAAAAASTERTSSILPRCRDREVPN